MLIKPTSTSCPLKSAITELVYKSPVAVLPFPLPPVTERDELEQLLAQFES